MPVRLTIQIVGWNSAAHLPTTLAALKNTPLSEVTVRYIDNASADDSVAIVRRVLPQAEIIELPENMGFAKAHNIGLSKCTTPFVLLHDPDVTLIWDGIQEILSAFDNDEVAAVQGKLLRLQNDGDTRPRIDSAGIVQTFTLNGRERGAGEIDKGQYNAPATVLAVTGACGLYRMSALKKVAYSKDEFFDNAFFAYKEDVDLGWRLKKAGYVSRYEPIVVGTHARTLGVGSKTQWRLRPGALIARLKNPRTRYSLRNYIWMVLKNADAVEFLLYDIFIEGRLFIFFCFSLFYPPFFSVWREIWQGAPNMLRKRVHKTPA